MNTSSGSAVQMSFTHDSKFQTVCEVFIYLIDYMYLYYVLNNSGFHIFVHNVKTLNLFVKPKPRIKAGPSYWEEFRVCIICSLKNRSKCFPNHHPARSRLLVCYARVLNKDNCQSFVHLLDVFHSSGQQVLFYK